MTDQSVLTSQPQRGVGETVLSEAPGVGALKSADSLTESMSDGVWAPSNGKNGRAQENEPQEHGRAMPISDELREAEIDRLARNDGWEGPKDREDF